MTVGWRRYGVTAVLIATAAVAIIASRAYALAARREGGNCMQWVGYCGCSWIQSCTQYPGTWICPGGDEKCIDPES